MLLQNTTANLCQAKATECARMAGIAGSSQVAEMYRKMEQRWLEFAAKAEAADFGTPNTG
jgi:hypothetical protein